MSFTSSASFFIEGKAYRTIWRVVGGTYETLEICTPTFHFDPSALINYTLNLGDSKEQLQTKITTCVTKIGIYNDTISECNADLALWDVWVNNINNVLIVSNKWVMDEDKSITQVPEDLDLNINPEQILSTKDDKETEMTMAQEHRDNWTGYRTEYEKLQTVLNNWLIGVPPAWGAEETARLYRLTPRHMARRLEGVRTEGLQEHVKLLF